VRWVAPPHQVRACVGGQRLRLLAELADIGAQEVTRPDEGPGGARLERR